MRTSVVALGFVLLLAPASSRSQWTLNGTPLTALRDGAKGATCAPDGAGGAIVAWYDNRSGNNDVYVQRIGAAGLPLWTAGGVVLTAAGDQSNPVIMSDGAGGAIVAWNGTSDIYAQRINAAGASQWTTNGVPLCAASGSQQFPEITSDGSGGAVVVWEDRRSGSDYDIYAQRINAAGSVQWTTDGVLLCANFFDQDNQQIVPIGVGGFVVVWEDRRNGGIDDDIYAQRVTPSGVVQWGASGVSVAPGLAPPQTEPRVVPDGTGGAFVTWHQGYGFSLKAMAQHLNASGVIQWTTTGFPLCGLASYQLRPAISADGAGGAVIAWEDDRAGGAGVYAQRVSPAGTPLWTQDGVAVHIGGGAPSLVPDGSGGYIVTWMEGSLGISEMSAQRLNAAGAIQWASGGVGVCRGGGSVKSPIVLPDGTGGTLFAWNDGRASVTLDQIYAGRLDNVHGFPGHPEPIVTSVADVKHDQGGVVAVNWIASSDDIINPRMIDFYSVWRAVDVIPLGGETVSLDDAKSLDLNAAAPVYLSASGYYFERVGTQSAHGWPGYSFVTQTRADSVASAAGDETFMIAAHSLYDDFVAFPSNVVTGHSVDNLAPAAPLLLVAQRVGAGVQLKWNRTATADLRDYSLYRATSSGVTPVPINFLESAEDTVAVDANAPSSALYYIVTAFDVHANQSAASNEASVGALTDVGNAPSINGLTVLQNHPNPFTATTDFEIGLPKAGDVRIEVFDVAGRRVRALDVHAQAGWNRVPFAPRDDRGRSLASGVYFYRVSAGGTAMTRKFVIAR